MSKAEHRCQFPVLECAIGGPFACDDPAPIKRDKWWFCEKHAPVYDQDQKGKKECLQF